ncbi:NAD(P)H-dependent glycerol-3-phosphate dehydrogenase [Bombilactobacillus folatiphilus]|uniref:Glycerol-3-phosphate dehydrogenase [NAD(P)+] n=1 Tax=Bombilactobacillus folatiphilus TaxID=2923362 RepID=A0ABY4P9E0_9LACO|nr:NAD(P)H-dependent glycerol-3-phosphate dehydrogenase [Bombilactobacillus folatiphilus]UQS82002.1 NAD(P)H-dependent glycerol-3-phosphate dehydrogenase [Bombilactobacillus folatiphilus]
MSNKISVLGAGSWGSILASILVQNGHDVTLWARNTDQVNEINQQHTNQRYLADFHYPINLTATTDLTTALTSANIILFTVPTPAIRSVAAQVQPIIAQHNQKPLIVHASKGLEQNTHLRISQILQEVLGNHQSGIVALSGPSHAEEVAKKDITLITAASTDLTAAKTVQQLFMNDYFRVYTNSDLIGVELGAALKNVIALGSGTLAGLGYGDNAKAALITRGLAEISRLGVVMGANPLTFTGLSGVGDLIVTCTSVHSRNWRAGNQLGQGQKLADVIAKMGMVVEGVKTCQSAYELAQQQHIDMPITQAIYQVLYQDADVQTEVKQLMQREGKAEI